jgi:hypothetical protein
MRIAGKGASVQTSLACVIVLLEPTTVAEDEFHDWYDTEHLPQRIAVPGLVTAERFVCTDGWPRYLALFDWDSLDVLNTPACKAARDIATRTPWTRRIMRRVRGWIRKEAVQIYPGRAKFGEKGGAARILLARISGQQDAHSEDIVESITRYISDAPGVVQWRLFKTVNEEESKNEYWLIVEYGFVVASEQTDLGYLHLNSATVDLINIYIKYWRSP